MEDNGGFVTPPIDDVVLPSQSISANAQQNIRSDTYTTAPVVASNNYVLPSMDQDGNTAEICPLPCSNSGTYSGGEMGPTESLGLDDLDMDYEQIMHYFDNLKVRQQNDITSFNNYIAILYYVF